MCCGGRYIVVCAVFNKQLRYKLNSPGSQMPSNRQGVESVLQKDAFLVFRALCKLSIRSSDAGGSTEVTALRGKVT